MGAGGQVQQSFLAGDTEPSYRMHVSDQRRIWREPQEVPLITSNFSASKNQVQSQEQ